MELSSLLIPLGIVPAIAVMYIFTSRYEGKYREKNILISFIAGMVVGMVIYIIEMPNAVRIIQKSLYAGDAILMAGMFSFLEQIAKYVILNMRMLRGEGLPIYGAALGAGFSSPFAPVFIRKIEINAYGILISIIPIMMVFLVAFSAILIGIGIKKGEAIKYFAGAFAFSMVIWLILFFTFYFKDNPLYFIFLFFLLLFITILSVYHAYYRLLPFSMLKRRELKKFL